MAKWFWNLIQKPGEMPAKTDLFPTVEDAQSTEEELVRSGTPQDNIFLLSWDDTEHIAKVEGNWADLSAEELRQLGGFMLGESKLDEGRLG